MKKALALFLALALLCSSALAADYDLNSLSDEDLVSFSQFISLLLFSRKLSSGIKVPAGIYMVGVDIPAGTYRIAYQDDPNSFASFMAVNEETSFGFTTILGFTGSSEIGKITLTEGTTVTIEAGDVYFYIYTGLVH